MFCSTIVVVVVCRFSLPVDIQLVRSKRGERFRKVIKVIKVVQVEFATLQRANSRFQFTIFWHISCTDDNDDDEDDEDEFTAYNAMRFFVKFSPQNHLK